VPFPLCSSCGALSSLPQRLSGLLSRRRSILPHRWPRQRPVLPTGGLPSTGASRHGCVRPGGGGGGGHAAEQGPAAAVRTSREKRRRDVGGPAMHGDAHWRLSPGLATFSSLSSFLSPTCHLVERLTTPTASALNVNLYLFWP
jgi:hypothetical protein